MGMFDIFGGGGSDVQAPDYTQAINTITQAGQTAADRGVFRPVTISTSFGTPQYTFDQQGRLTGASYEAAPWLQALQTGQQGLAGTYLNAAQNAAQNTQGLTAANQAFGGAGTMYNAGNRLLGLAGEALPTSYDITSATKDYYNRMQEMAAPKREQQLASTRQSLFNKGRQGLAVGATQAGGQLATNPEMAAYYNAIAQQDLGLANEAEQRARANLQQDIATGTGLYRTGADLFGAGLQQGIGGGSIENQQYQNWVASQAPMATSLGQLNTMESMAQSPLQLGLQFGTPTTQGMQYGGNMLFNAAQTASGLQANQATANAAAANANNAPGFWESLGGSLISTGLTAGLGMGMGALPGLFSGAAGGSAALGGLTSAGAGLAGGINTGGFGGGFNPMQGFQTNPYSSFRL